MVANRKKMLSSIAFLAIGTFLFFGAQGCKSDLIVEIYGPSNINAGSSPDIVTVEVRNIGNTRAPGTISPAGETNSDGYMVDIVLSSDNYLPVQNAVVSDTFEEDMLLIGGRISRTQDLAPGESKTYSLSAPSLLIPPDTPQGEYCLGAIVDPGKKVEESNENNNTACHNISIIHEETAVTTVVVVRHAERANDALTSDGEKRAETLARILSESGTSVVLSTNTIRTRETVNNYADPRSIQIDIYTTVEEVTNIIKSQHVGKVVLVAGHAPTVPQIIEGLGVSSAPSIGNEFNNLFIVTICTDGVASLTHLKYEIHHDLY